QDERESIASVRRKGRSGREGIGRITGERQALVDYSFGQRRNAGVARLSTEGERQIRSDRSRTHCAQSAERRHVKWSRPDPDAIVIDDPTSLRTRVRAMRPGRSAIDVSAHDAAGNQLESMKIQRSVPQFVGGRA